METKALSCTLRDPLEVNLSYMPFVTDGGLFIATPDNYSLGDAVLADLQLPGKKDILKIEGKVVWITPRNALHHVLPGIGIQFTGQNAPVVRATIESCLDPSFDIGGYTYGMTDSGNTSGKK